MIKHKRFDEGKLLKTGQLTQYGGYNDDGFYEMGISKRYTVLTLGVYAGHTHIIMNGKDEPHDNACVYDRRTKLMWSRYFPHHVGPAADGKMPWTTNVNGEGIFAYCVLANAALLAGYSDWRIPNLLETMSILDLEAPTAFPNAVAFPSVPSTDYVWTSTTRPSLIINAMTAIFEHGFGYIHTKTDDRFMMLVRGG